MAVETIMSTLDDLGPGTTLSKSQKVSWRSLVQYQVHKDVHFNWRKAQAGCSISRDIWNLPSGKESVFRGLNGMCLQLASTLTSLENLLWQTGAIVPKKKGRLLDPGTSSGYHQMVNKLLQMMKLQTLNWWHKHYRHPCVHDHVC